MRLCSSRSGPRPRDPFGRLGAAAAPGLACTAGVLALAGSLAGCVERRADGTLGGDTVTLIDTGVRMDTQHVRDTLVGLGDTENAAQGPPAASGTAAASPPLATPAPPTPAPATGSAAPPVSPADLQSLVDRKLQVPIAGIPAARLPDTFNESRGTHAHEALDILAPRGTPVHSADDGVVLKLFTSKAGGITVYARDPSGRFIYYYAHLDHYAPGLTVGQPLRKGDVIGYVGSTGDASASVPHLHFAIARSDDMSQWWKGTPIDPTPVLQGRVAR